MNTVPFEQMSGAYQTLSDLLKSQREALDSEDDRRLANLFRLIETYLKRIRKFSSELPGLSHTERSELAAKAKDLSRQIEQNREQWQRESERLQQLARQLRAARRYVRQSGSSSADRNPRVTHIG